MKTEDEDKILKMEDGSMIKTMSFRDLDVWKNAHKFVLQVYKVTGNFPKSELFGLVSQFRRASISIAANIAEGYKKKGKLDKLRFFNIAQGSLEECHYYAILSKDLNYFDENTERELYKQIESIGKMLNSYCKKVENDLYTQKNSSINP